MTGSPAKRQGERSTISTSQRARASGNTLAMSTSRSCISKRRRACRSRACSMDRSSSSRHCSNSHSRLCSSSSLTYYPPVPSSRDRCNSTTHCLHQPLLCRTLSPTGYNLHGVQSLAKAMTCAAVTAAGRGLLDLPNALGTEPKATPWHVATADDKTREEACVGVCGGGWAGPAAMAAADAAATGWVPQEGRYATATILHAGPARRLPPVDIVEYWRWQQLQRLQAKTTATAAAAAPATASPSAAASAAASSAGAGEGSRQHQPGGINQCMRCSWQGILPAAALVRHAETHAAMRFLVTIYSQCNQTLVSHALAGTS